MFAASKSGKAAAAAVVTDPYFMYVPLLLNTTSTNGQQNNTFLDSSTNNFTITRNGTPTQGSFTPYQPSGYWSGNFGTAGDSISVPTSTALQFGTGAFCIELFFNTTTNTQYACFVSNEVGATGFTILINDTASAGDIAIYNGSAGLILSTTTRYNDGAWHHLVYCRDGTSARLYIDGVLKNTNTGQNTFAMDAGSSWYFSNNNTYAGRQLLGNMSNIRVVKGSAVYSGSTITVPTSPLTAISGTSLLTLQDNRFKDNSASPLTLTVNGTPKVQAFQPFSPAASYSAATYGGSGYFNGSTDYLSLADNAALQLSTGDFTIEGWFYISGATSTAYNLISKGAAATGWSLNTTTGARIQFSYTASNLTGSTTTLVANAWYHIAVVRSGSASGNLKIYLNGVQEIASAGAVNDDFNQTSTMYISASRTATVPLNGYSSNIRVVKGTAIYTAAFTPPTLPVTAVSGTSLLTNFGNAGIYDAAWQNNALTVGDAQASTTQYKWSPTSMKFDGTGDWLTAIDSPGLQLGSGDFTIEGWFYLSATGAIYGIVSKGTATTGWSVNVTVLNKLQFSYTASNLTGATSLSASTWYYFAVVRSGTATGNLKVYLNGTADATSGGAVTDNFNQTSTFYTGADRIGGSALNGYLQDIRLTKGYARTVTTTPTAAFPTR